MSLAALYSGPGELSRMEVQPSLIDAVKNILVLPCGGADDKDVLITGLMSEVDEPYLEGEVKWKGVMTMMALEAVWKKIPEEGA